MVLHALGDALNFLLDPVLFPLLKLHPFWAIVIISLLIAVVISLIYKLVTDQEQMHSLKAEMKGYQKEMKTLRSNPQEMMKIQRKAMETNMKYMSHSFKPTIYTFLPIIIIFSWLAAHLAYYPIIPGEEFSTTMMFKDDAIGMTVTLIAPEDIEIISDTTQTIIDGQASWKLKGTAGKYFLTYQFDGREYEKDVWITNTKDYAKVEDLLKDDLVKSIKIDNKPIKPMGNIKILGWQPGWLGTYILASLVFSLIIRKILNLA